MLPDSEKRNTKAILHGIGHVLHGFNQDITEEPLPQALTELVKRLEATLTRSSRAPVVNYRLTKDRHTAGMVETAEQHSKISKRYDKLADDESMSLEQRAKFARSANCHRILARIQQTQAIRDQVIQPSSRALSAAA